MSTPSSVHWIGPLAVSRFRNHLNDRGLGSGTVDKYEGILDGFLSDMQDTDSGERGILLPAHYLEWLGAKRSGGASASTLKLYLAAGKSYAKWAGTGLQELSEYRLPPLAEPTPHPLPNGLSDARAMMNFCHGEGGPHAPSRAQVLIALCALAGLRVNEAVDAEVTHIQTRTDKGERYLVLVVKGKGEKVREVPVSDELAEILAPCGPGKLAGYTNSGARAAITRIAAAAGVTGHTGGGVSSHDLRATFATALYEATGDIVLVQRALGHADVKTTQAYIGTSASRTRAAVNLL